MEVVGPESALRRLRQAVTEPVSIDGATTTRREPVTVGVPDPAVRLVRHKRPRSTVTLTPEGVERTIHGVRVAVRRAPSPLAVNVEPEVVTVIVRGLPAVVDGLSADRLAVWVDGEELQNGTTSLDVRADLPAGIELVQLQPGQVRVEATRRR